MSSDNETIVLINESKRRWSFPSRPVPTAKSKLNERGKPRSLGVGELEQVESYRAPLLQVGERIEVPRWYFEELRAIKGLKAVFNRKVDGIAVGRTRAEQQTAAVADRENELASRASSAEAKAAQLERELSAVKAQLEKAAEKAAEKADEKNTKR